MFSFAMITHSTGSEQRSHRKPNACASRMALAICGLLLCLVASTLWAEEKTGSQPSTTEKAGEAADKKDVPSTAVPPAAKDATTPASQGGDSTAPGYGNRTAPEPIIIKKLLPPPPPPVPADLIACKVQFRVGFGTDPLLGPQDRQDFLVSLEEHCGRWIGDTWQMTITQEPKLSPGGAFLLERLTPNVVLDQYQPGEADKVYLMTLESAPGGAGFRLAAREWDTATRQLSPLRERTIFVRSALGAEALQLVHELYRPIVQIERVGKTENRLRALAGDINPPDPNWKPLRTGAIFEGYTRYLDKKKIVQRILPVAWSYITVGKIQRGVAACTVVSGLKNPFRGKQRMMEDVGLEIRRDYPYSDLILLTRGRNPRPQTGLEVEVLSDAKPKIVDKKPQPDVLHRLLSNRLGIVRIPAEIPSGTDKVWIVVRSSMVPLAKVPYIPGLHATDQIQLPDDSLRLRVEGELTLLQADIVDTVARREVIHATARAQKKTGNVKRVEELISEFDSLPTGDQFTGKLTALRVSSTDQAKKNRDRVAETRIVKLCSETADMINKHLDPDKVHSVRDSLVDIRTNLVDEAKFNKQVQDFQNVGGDDPRTRRNQKSTTNEKQKKRP